MNTYEAIFDGQGVTAIVLTDKPLFGNFVIIKE